MKLFEKCHHCGQPAASSVQAVKGSLVRIKQDCPHCKKEAWTWDSQPFVRDVPAGNLIMSAAILFSGNIYFVQGSVPKLNAVGVNTAI